MKVTVRQARVGTGMSQREMADVLGVSEMTYNIWERDPLKMRIGKLIEFIRITGVEFSDLIIGDDNDRTAKMG